MDISKTIVAHDAFSMFNLEGDATDIYTEPAIDSMDPKDYKMHLLAHLVGDDQNSALTKVTIHCIFGDDREVKDVYAIEHKSHQRIGRHMGTAFLESSIDGFVRSLKKGPSF